jgi:hypothetical protein
MDIYEDEEDEEVIGAPKADGRDNPEFNPYTKGE